MISEITLSNWTLPSSDTEIEKQERAERMIRQAIDAHEAFQNCSLKVYTKGSYANNTNVRSDSDVDIAVECTEALYWDESEKGNHQTSGNLYQGIWTPAKLRAELILAMKKKFPDQVDISGVTAIQINANSAHIYEKELLYNSYFGFLVSSNELKYISMFVQFQLPHSNHI
jgi:predicted nucleotidyltransferase